MIFSYNWLATFFTDNLPETPELKKGIEEHFFEVESVEEGPACDKLFDINILPNRAADALSYIGLAREVAAIFDLKLKEEAPNLLVVDENVERVEVEVETESCRRFMARPVDGVKIGPSPDWLKSRIESMGGKSINNIVDLTNFVLFETGQPLHVYDAEKVKGVLKVRQAKAREEMTTLDNKELILTAEDILICDDDGALSLAGVKGGKKAEVTPETTAVILESANFDPATVRRSAARFNLRTDAVKRFENNIAPEKAEEGMRLLSEKILELMPEARCASWQDFFTPRQQTTITTSATYISERLGIEVAQDEVVEILSKIRLEPAVEGGDIVVTVPFDRQDLLGEDDLVEEVGRLRGYGDVPVVIPTVGERAPDTKVFLVSQKIREVLLEIGFSEIYGYTFSTIGEVEVASPLSKDQPFLRPDLASGLENTLALNIKNILFDDESVKVFEIGSVFPDKDVEEMRVAVGILYKKEKLFNKNKEEIELTKKSLIESLGLKEADIDFKVTDILPTPKEAYRGVVIEFNLSRVLEKVATPKPADLSQFFADAETKYKPVSPYPRIIRDIALFVPKVTEKEEVQNLIKDKAGELLHEGPVLFDEFTKDGGDRTSLAFRMSFQADDRTLEDEEVNKIMAKITKALETKNWEVR